MIEKRYGLMDYLVLVYTFLLALLMVTPYFGLVNFASIGLSCVGMLVALKKYKAPYNKLFLFYLLPFVWLALGLFFVKHQGTASSGLLSLFKNTVTAIIPALFINSTTKFKNVMWAFVLGGSFNIFNNIIFGHNALSTGERYLSEDSALTLNSFAHGTMIYLIAAVVILYFNTNNVVRAILIAYVLACLTSLMITGSRQSYVSLFALFLSMIVLQFSRLSFQTLIRIVLMCLFVGLTTYVIFVEFPESPIVQRFTSGGTEGDEDRLELIEIALALVIESPIIGYGVGSFTYYSRYVYTHSSHMEILFVGGVLYSILFYIFYYFFFKAINRAYKLEKFVRGKDNFRINFLFKSVVICILVNGFFYMIHSSRLALTLEFYILNYVLSKAFFLVREGQLKYKV